MKYSEFLERLQVYAEADFAEFQRKLIPTKQKIIGVRTPIMRKIAKEVNDFKEEIFAYPDEIYEVTFIKLTIISTLPYEEFIKKLSTCVSKIDNWATCDSFKVKCIKTHREEFLTVLADIFINGSEFYQRYVLVSLLNNYVETKYFPIIIKYLKRANLTYYYVSMAAAWLTAEVLIKDYENGLRIIKTRILDATTHNKAIQKAIESYRLNKEQKAYLRSLKIKVIKNIKVEV